MQSRDQSEMNLASEKRIFSLNMGTKIFALTLTQVLFNFIGTLSCFTTPQKVTKL